MQRKLLPGNQIIVGSTGSTALVLSAGGLFGAWQAGVWEAIENVFDPDIVVGASVGSLNGWMIACGCNSAELTRKWTEAGKLAAIRWRMPQRLTDGLLDDSELRSWIEDACRQRKPKRRYGVVLTHLRTLRPTLFEWPAADWTYIAGSCGVPLFLRQTVIDRQLYSDGGFIDPLPVQAALDMGATKIVTVNVMNVRPALIDAGVRCLRRLTGSRHDVALRDAEIINISPQGRVGTVRESMYWDERNIRRWIDEGREAGLRRQEALRNVMMR